MKGIKMSENEKIISTAVEKFSNDVIKKMEEAETRREREFTYKLKELELGKTVSGFAAVPTLNRNDVHLMESIIPSKAILLEFENEMLIIHHNLTVIKQENVILTELQSLLLAKIVV